MAILYTTKATSHGGREGEGASEDGRLQVKLSTPKEMGGSGGAGTNPEQLFGVGYSACFLGALKFVAGKAKVKLPADPAVTATISFAPREDGTGFEIFAALEASLPGLEQAVADDLVQKAHIVCPYSHATRGGLDVKLSAKV